MWLLTGLIAMYKMGMFPRNSSDKLYPTRPFSRFSITRSETVISIGSDYNTEDFYTPLQDEPPLLHATHDFIKRFL